MTTNTKIKAYIEEIVNDQKKEVRDALALISDENRHLLALRGYVRHPSRIDSRWPWTSDEEETFKDSNKWTTMKADITAIKNEFKKNNKGYSLITNQKSRSLTTQLDKWNNRQKRGGKIVLSFGKRLWKAAETELNRKNSKVIGGKRQESEIYPEKPTTDSTEDFRKWLSSTPHELNLAHKVEGKRRTTPSLATPGLSAHGRLKAIDFTVMKGDERIASSDSGSVSIATWTGDPNWKKQLKSAITNVSTNWDGPLKSPNEPWHYYYVG